MKTVQDIVGYIGHRKLSGALGVVDTAISNAIAKSMFPAKWYLIIKSECDCLGIECPNELFSFIQQSQDDDA